MHTVKSLLAPPRQTHGIKHVFTFFVSSLGNSDAYTCPKCGRTYDKRPSFAKHFKFCGVDFECEYCGKRYSRSDSVKKHQRLAHSLNS